MDEKEDGNVEYAEESPLTRICPALEEENLRRKIRWEKIPGLASLNIINKFDPRKESIVSLNYCNSFGCGRGCPKKPVCWSQLKDG